MRNLSTAVYLFSFHNCTGCCRQFVSYGTLQMERLKADTWTQVRRDCLANIEIAKASAWARLTAAIANKASRRCAQLWRHLVVPCGPLRPSSPSCHPLCTHSLVQQSDFLLIRSPSPPRFKFAAFVLSITMDEARQRSRLERAPKSCSLKHGGS
uniref:Uncharacterized protein n=1 Tax=Rhipicephalus zambeziensis TaxID=60191 RepID=A0A224Y769_9ACAR